IFVAWILMRGGNTKENLNLRAAFLQVLGDMLGSGGAVVAAVLIMLFNWGWADALASVIVALLVLISGWRVTRDAVHVLMQGTRNDVDLADIRNTMENALGIL